MKIAAWMFGVCAMAIAGIVVLAGGKSASAGIDLTGTWDFAFSGDLVGQCELEMEQDGNVITGTFECPELASGQFEGTITMGESGAALDIDMTINVDGGPTIDAGAIGEVAPDGNSFEGMWDGAFNTGGTFEGTRLTGPPTPEGTPTPTPEPTPTPFPFAKGDVDCDGDVDAVDALKVLQSVAGLPYGQDEGCPEIGSGEPPFGDMDCDGDVDAVDALLILRLLAGLQVNLPPGCGEIGV